MSEKSRKRYDVYPKKVGNKRCWFGWYYDREGKRKMGVPLKMGTALDRVPVNIPVTDEDPRHCQHRDLAVERMKQEYEARTAVVVGAAPSPPTIQEAIDLYMNHKKDINEHLTGKHLREIRGRLENGIRGIRRHGKIMLSEDTRVKGTGWKTVLDIHERGFREFLGRLREHKRSRRTRTLFLREWVAFAEWCRIKAWLPTNPLSAIVAERKGQSKRDRYEGRVRFTRPFTREEFEKLVATVQEDRRLSYLAMGLAGLRRSEVRSMEKWNCELEDMSKPRWRLRSTQQKSRLPASLPMMPRLAQELKPLWDALEKPNDKLFPPFHEYKTLYKDFKRAGIERENEQGKLGNHSFRYFFATEMSKIYGMIKVSMLMRHQDITQTASVYVDYNLHDKDEEWRLEDF